MGDALERRSSQRAGKEKCRLRAAGRQLLAYSTVELLSFTIFLGRWGVTLALVKAGQASEAGALPDEKDLARMGEFNQELANAGVLLSGEGLQASAKGARVEFSGGKTTVVRGPLPQSEDLIAGFWLWQVSSLHEAIRWVQRAPFDDGARLEIRPVLEAEDLGPAFTPELREQEEQMRARLAART